MGKSRQMKLGTIMLDISYFHKSNIRINLEQIIQDLKLENL